MATPTFQTYCTRANPPTAGEIYDCSLCRKRRRRREGSGPGTNKVAWGSEGNLDRQGFVGQHGADGILSPPPSPCSAVLLSPFFSPPPPPQWPYPPGRSWVSSMTTMLALKGEIRSISLFVVEFIMPLVCFFILSCPYGSGGYPGTGSRTSGAEPLLAWNLEFV